MKKTVFLSLLAIMLVLGFIGCENGIGTNGNGFVSTIDDTVSNDVETLGFIGHSVVSNDTNVVTAEIVSGKIRITSVSEGSALVTVKPNYVHIPVTISKTGAITIGTIVRYSPTSIEGWVKTLEYHMLSTKDWVTIHEDLGWHPVYTEEGRIPSIAEGQFEGKVVAIVWPNGVVNTATAAGRHLCNGGNDRYKEFAYEISPGVWVFPTDCREVSPTAFAKPHVQFRGK